MKQHEKTTENSIYLYPTDEEEVKRTIKSLKSNTSTGLARLKVNIMKSLMDEITPAITTVVNKTLELGIWEFPKCSKKVFNYANIK